MTRNPVQKLGRVLLRFSVSLVGSMGFKERRVWSVFAGHIDLETFSRPRGACAESPGPGCAHPGPGLAPHPRAGGS